MIFYLKYTSSHPNQVTNFKSDLSGNFFIFS